MGAPGTLPLPCALQDLLADGEGNGSAQVRARQGGPQEASDVRGHPTPLRQEEEDGHPFCPPGAQAQAWQEVLLPWTSVARSRMEVPRRRRDVGGEAPRQGRGVLQEGIDRCQNQAAGAQGPRWSRGSQRTRRSSRATDTPNFLGTVHGT